MLDALKTTRARAYEIWHKYGTISTLDTSVLSGDTPIKNWAGIGVRDYGTKNLEKFGTNTVIKDNVKPMAAQAARWPAAHGLGETLGTALLRGIGLSMRQLPIWTSPTKC